MSDPRSWLNNLSADLVERFYNWNRGRCANVPVLNSDVPEELFAFAPLNPGDPDGAMWKDHITCETIGPPGTLFDFSGEYPRWQIQFKKRNADESVATPAARGSTAGAADVRTFFENNGSLESWTALKSVSTASAGKFALGFHHIAFRASNPEMPLPADLGSGTAIAHLCDNHRCVKKSHMLLLSQQRNMDMQRCTGAVLLVKDGVIVQTLQCPHYRQESVVVQPSCAKLRVIDLGTNLVIASQSLQAFEAARALYTARVDELIV